MLSNLNLKFFEALLFILKYSLVIYILLWYLLFIQHTIKMNQGIIYMLITSLELELKGSESDSENTVS